MGLQSAPKPEGIKNKSAKTAVWNGNLASAKYKKTIIRYLSTMKICAITSSLLFFLFLSTAAHAQKIDTVYFSADWKPMPKSGSSYYRTIKTVVAGKNYQVTDHYATGEVQMTGKFTSLSPEVMDGEVSWYYQNGALSAQAFFVNGKINSGKEWDEQGKETLMKITEEPAMLSQAPEKFPLFPGGTQEIYKFIGDHFVYPNELKNSPKGKIQVKFVVDGEGKVVDVKVVQGLHPLLDKEAVRVVSSLPRWEPGVQNGKNVRVAMNLPININ